MKSNLGFDLIPEGIRELPVKPIKIGGKKILALFDIHFPFHDKKALETAIEFDSGYDTIIIGGDMLDMYSGSKFCKDPGYKKMQDEIKIGKHFFEFLRNKFPKAEIHYIEGNHDIRLKKYLWDHAQALAGLEVLKLSSLLELDKHKVHFYDNGTILKAGGLHILHGNETGVKGGKNPARTMLYNVLDNVIFGHFHKSQTIPSRRIGGEEVVTRSVGCLCYLNPAYMPIGNEWGNGFAIIEIDNNKFNVQNKRILSDYSVVSC